MTAAACPTGKAVLTRELAVQRAKRSAQHYTIAMAPYRCETCGQWHIGAPSRKMKQHKMKVVKRR